MAERNFYVSASLYIRKVRDDPNDLEYRSIVTYSYAEQKEDYFGGASKLPSEPRPEYGRYKNVLFVKGTKPYVPVLRTRVAFEWATCEVTYAGDLHAPRITRTLETVATESTSRVEKVRVYAIEAIEKPTSMSSVQVDEELVSQCFPESSWHVAPRKSTEHKKAKSKGADSSRSNKSATTIASSGKNGNGGETKEVRKDTRDEERMQKLEKKTFTNVQSLKTSDVTDLHEIDILSISDSAVDLKRSFLELIKKKIKSSPSSACPLDAIDDPESPDDFIDGILASEGLSTEKIARLVFSDTIPSRTSCIVLGDDYAPKRMIRTKTSEKGTYIESLRVGLVLS